MPKAPKSKQMTRHDPLHVQIDKENSVELFAKPIKHKEKQVLEESDIVDSKTSKKILKMIREQQSEIANEESLGQDEQQKVLESMPLKPLKKSTSSRKNVDSDESDIDVQDYEEWDQGNDLVIIDS